MTVADLIAKLQQFDGNLPFVMPSENFDFCEVDSAFIDLFAVVDGKFQMADERDPDRIEMIRLFEPELLDHRAFAEELRL